MSTITRGTTESLGFVTTITTYDPQFTYRASAGMGAYNTSLVQPDIIPPFDVASYVSQYYTTILRDTTFGVQLDRPTSCSPSELVCGSRLFVGDYSFIYPVPSFISNFTDATVVVAHQISGVQVDIVGVTSGDVDVSDCKIFGTNFTALQICLTASPTTPNGLIAGHSLQ